MGKKKKAKAAIHGKPDKVPEATCKVDIGDETKKAVDQAPPKEKSEDVLPKTENKGISKEDGMFAPEIEKAMNTPTAEETEPEKDPEPVSKLVVPDTELFGDKVEDAGMEKVPEGMVKIPCECINCRNKFDLYVPKGIGTSILYYRDCEKCR